MTSPARPGQGPWALMAGKRGLCGQQAAAPTRGQGSRRGRAARSPAGVTSAHHSVSPHPGQPLSRMLVKRFLLGAHGGGTCRVSGAWKRAAPAAQAFCLCRHTGTPGRSSSQGPYGGLCSGAACLCPMPHRLPVADQDPLPNLGLSRGSEPSLVPGSCLQPPPAPTRGTSGLLQGGQGEPAPVHHSFSQFTNVH